MARLDSETIGDIFRSALLVLAFWGLLSGLWPAVGGMTGQFAGASESVSVQKDIGITTAPWDTQEAPSQSWIKVHMTSNLKATVLIVALNARDIRVANVSNFAAADDFLAVDKGNGTDVVIGGGHGGPVVYRISVHIHPDAKIQNPGATDANLSYTLTWEVQKMDPMVIVGGLVLFSMFFVTEYMLHLRRDIRQLTRRMERLMAEGGVRAPVAALGTPPITVPHEEEPLAERERPRGGFFGKRGGEPREAAAQRPSESVADAPLGPPRYAASAPVPESFAPPPPAASPYAPPPAYAAAPAYAAPPAYAPPPPYNPQPPYGTPTAPARSDAGPSPPPPPTTRSAAPSAPAPAPAAPEGQEPVSKVRCPQCKHIVPVFTMERPTPIRCPNCGKRGMLTK